MQCAFEFLILIIETHSWLKDFFNYSIKFQFQCVKCHQEKIKIQDKFFIKINKPFNIGSIKFAELFEEITTCKCDCRQINNCTSKLDFDLTNFLIIRINTVRIIYDTNRNVIIENNKTKLDDFDPENVLIPGSQTKFKVLAAILYYYESKHYVLIKKHNHNSWIIISDSSYKIIDNFTDILNYAMIIILKKE
ncbi:unnamed protein product [Brachionus calyciflorus]|uniref:USP domain-containing protein n=1 Tax=Brachionus calyciflorus TaxID=104777 RepID=A0A814Q885_9BILA|nr:unnamed protein product [Brachionus calyciflorus]